MDVFHRTAAMTEVAGGVAAVSARLSRVGATGGGSGAGHSMWRNISIPFVSVYFS